MVVSTLFRLLGFSLCFTLVLVASAMADPPTVVTPLGEASTANDRPGLLRAQSVAVNLDGVRDPGAVAALRLDLFEDFRADVLVDRTTVRSSESFSLMGHLDGDAQSSAIVTVEDGLLVAEVRTGDGEVYRVRPLSAGVHEVRQMDLTQLPECGVDDGSPPARLAGFPSTSSITPDFDDGSEIDALFVYTPDVVSTNGGTTTAVEAQIRSAVDGTNASYVRSLITTEIRIVGMELISYTETGNSRDELNRLIRPSDGFMDEVHTIRNSVGADVVCFIGNYTLDACGRATILDFQGSSEDEGWSVVHGDRCLDMFTVAHEFGHNFGCQHNRAFGSSNPLFPWSYGHKFTGLGGTNYRTIMAYPPDAWIEHFSNPNVNFDGVPTGIPEGQPLPSDNARTINTTAVTLANFRQAVLPTVSIADAQVTEGDAGTNTMSFQVELSFGVNQTVLVGYATSDDTATAGSDFNSALNLVIFPPNTTVAFATVEVIGDTTAEGNEALKVNLTGPNGAVIGDGEATGTIIDNEGTTVSLVPPAAANEADGGVSTIDVEIQISNAIPQEARVNYATLDGSALAGTDYTATSGTAIFPPSTTTSQMISIPYADNALDDGVKSFSVLLTSPQNVLIGQPVATVFILDDEGPDISINDVAVTEGDAGSVNAVFSVSLSAPTTDTVFVSYFTADETASEFLNDYTPTTGSLTWNPNDTTPMPVTVEVNGDLLGEADETFRVILQSAFNGTIVDDTGIGTILNDDGAQPTLSINDAGVAEGNAGSTDLVFDVVLSAATPVTVEVDYFATDITAEDGTDYDQANTFGTITFPANTTAPQPVTVEVFGDTVPESDETFSITLNTPINAGIAIGTAEGTIINDDGVLPTVSIADTSVTEGDSGSVFAVFDVTLSDPTTQQVTVDYFSTDVTATDAADYDQANGFGTVTFAAGTTGPEPVSIEVFGDTLAEGNETFTVTLNTPINTVISDGLAIGTINDDDGAAPMVSISDVTVTESDVGAVNAVFMVTLSGATGADVMVDYFTADNTALGGADFTSATGTVTIPSGTITPQPVTVEVAGDVLVEADETFSVTLTTPQNATIDDGLGVGTIEDEDPKSASILAHLLGNVTLNLAEGDANGDGVIDVADLVIAVNRGL